jgi:hypothetical protein
VALEAGQVRGGAQGLQKRRKIRFDHENAETAFRKRSEGKKVRRRGTVLLNFVERDAFDGAEF